MKCPVCGQPNFRTLLAAFLLGALLFFVGGQLFSYYLTPVPDLKKRLEKTEERNDELKKWFNPPPPKKGEPKGIEF
jgi:hypothetical protein